MRLLLTIVVFVWAWRASADEAMRPDAKARYDAGMTLYRAHDYIAAVREFQAAYGLDPRREILFAQAQATRLSGDCGAALPLYERFLATKPPPQQVEATRIAVTRCAEVPRAPEPLAVMAPLPPPAKSRWYHDRLGGVLVGAGLAAIAAGTGLLMSAATLDRDARRSQHLDDYGAARAKAVDRQRLGVATTVAGALLVVGGTGRYLWISPGGAGMGGRF